MDGLNKEQRRAVEAPDGPVMIVAGPGTGKTKTLTSRILFLVQQRSVAPENILALTFTKKASEEMRARVKALLPGASPKITTFHALCHELLGGDITFVSEAERLKLVRSLTRPLALKHLSVRELGLMISRAKNQPPEQAAEPALQKVVAQYNTLLHEQHLSDFDDLLLQSYELLKHDEPKRSAVRAQYRHVLVDEFQDTNLLQYELLRLLCGNQHIFIIGDPNQSIYGFRGASGDIFGRFLVDYPKAEKITLHVNYRSGAEIVKVANAIFASEGTLSAQPGRHGRVRAVLTLNEYSEAQWVLDEIERAIGGGDFLRAVSDDERSSHRRLSDFAVLYRSRACAMTLQKAFAASGLPYQIVGDGSPYEKPLVQNIILLLKALASGEEVAIQGLSKNQCRTLLGQVDQIQPPTKVVESIIRVFGFEPSADLTQLMNLLIRFDHLEPALAYLDQIAEGHFYDPNADAVTLLTIHASKGLEFPCVFLIGAEEGILPHEKADEQEERRLFYVAVTRAEENLDITHTKMRAGDQAKISNFVAGLPESVLPKITDPSLSNDERRAHKRKMKRSQQSMF
jgi:DNA helicase II / ATP-dependent DNA helicase PcrA